MKNENPTVKNIHFFIAGFMAQLFLEVASWVVAGSMGVEHKFYVLQLVVAFIIVMVLIGQGDE
jgi:hypothetical protein